MEQQRDGVHAVSLHTMITDDAPSASKTMSAHQPALSITQAHTQTVDGFSPQHGRGGVNRAPPGLQQGVNIRWWRSIRVIPGLPPGLRHGVTDQQQGSVRASPKLHQDC